MKLRTMMMLCVALCLASCAAPSDPTFMLNSAATIHGGMVQGPEGRMMMSSGLQNRNRPHPFFGAP